MAGFYRPLLEHLAHTRDAGFVDAAIVDRLRVDTDAQRLLRTLRDETASSTARKDFTPI